MDPTWNTPTCSFRSRALTSHQTMFCSSLLPLMALRSWSKKDWARWWSDSHQLPQNILHITSIIITIVIQSIYKSTHTDMSSNNPSDDPKLLHWSIQMGSISSIQLTQVLTFVGPSTTYVLCTNVRLPSLVSTYYLVVKWPVSEFSDPYSKTSIWVTNYYVHSMLTS